MLLLLGPKSAIARYLDLLGKSHDPLTRPSGSVVWALFELHLQL